MKVFGDGGNGNCNDSGAERVKRSHFISCWSPNSRSTLTDINERAPAFVLAVDHETRGRVGLISGRGARGKHVVLVSRL